MNWSRRSHREAIEGEGEAIEGEAIEGEGEAIEGEAIEGEVQSAA